jgi:hypothetical protein
VVLDSGVALLAAACVTALGGIITVLLRLKKENHKDHQVVQGLIRIMYNSQQRSERHLVKLQHTLEEHLEDHKESSSLESE